MLGAEDLSFNEVAQVMTEIRGQLRSIVEDRQVECGEPCDIGQDIDLDDLPVGDRETHDREQLTVRASGDDSDRSVHQSRTSRKTRQSARKRDRQSSHCLGAADLPAASGRRWTAVRSEDDIRVEHRQQPGEVAAARSGEEGIDRRSLVRPVRIGSLFYSLDPYPPAGPAGKLAGRARRAPDDLGNLVEGHREHVVEDKRDAFGRRQLPEDHEQREPERVGQDRLVLGIDAAGSIHDRVRHVDVE